jgi:hypothetical protein
MKATLNVDGWELESAEERNRSAPDRFHIPAATERQSLNVGQIVQLLFLIQGHDDSGDYIQCERMWVTVSEVSVLGYVGALESLPSTSPVLQPGALISFEAHHVSSIFIPKTDPRHPDYATSNRTT